MKKIVLLLAAGIAAFGLTACGGGGTTTTTETAGTEAAETTEAAGSGETEAPAAADLSQPSIVVEFGDFDGIQTVMKQMQNMEIAEGTVIKITGIYQKDTSTPAVMEENAEGNTKLGLLMYLPEGTEEVPNGTKIEVVGVAARGTYVMEFHVPEGFTVLE